MDRQGEMKGKPRNGREEMLASHRSSSEKRRKGAFLRRVAVEANHGLYSDRPCSALFHSLSRPLGTLIELVGATCTCSWNLI